MVEEMYKEEFGASEMDSNSSSENATKGRDEAGSSEDRGDLLQSPGSDRGLRSSGLGEFPDSLKPNLIPNMETEGPAADDTYRRTNGEDCSLLQAAIAQSDNSGRFMAYHQMSEMGRYGGTGGVSLTLGLQHCDEGSLTAADGQQGFLTVRGEDIYSTAAPSLGFGPSHRLHDFVA